MNNKKLMMLNIAILCTIVAIMSIGYRTWGTTQQMKEESVVAGELIDNEQEQIMDPKELPLLKNSFDKKKRESDFDSFIQEEVEIIELEVTEAEEHPIPDQMNHQDIDVDQTNTKLTNSVNMENTRNKHHESLNNSSTTVKEESSIHNHTTEEPHDNTDETSPIKESNHLDEEETEDTQQLEEDRSEQPEGLDESDISQEETELEAESRVNNE